jgi:aryl-alcohol dehydrogenase-like predicted oxidoreductase
MLDRIALGTAQFGLLYGVSNQNRVSQRTAADILAAARAVGVDTLDTAIAYGDSESVLGSIGVAGWKVISKLPAVPDDCAEVGAWVAGQVQASLRRLGIDTLEAVLLHRPLQLSGSAGEALLAALLAIRRDGLVRKIGVSIYGTDEIAPILERHRFDVLQAPCSILDQRIIRSGWSGRLVADGVELHTRSAFLQGLLLMAPHARPKKFARWNGVWATWDAWLAQSGLSAAEACTRFALAAPGVGKIVAGFDSVVQFEQIAAAAEKPLETLPAWPELDERLLNPSYWSQL